MRARVFDLTGQWSQAAAGDHEPETEELNWFDLPLPHGKTVCPNPN